MPDSVEGHSTAVSGGSGSQPTPANNISGGGNGPKEGLENIDYLGPGHVPADNPRSTMGSVLGLEQQKTRAENKFYGRQNAAAHESMGDHGGPTCANEDHTFMEHKAGGPDTLPGWNTMKHVFGSMSGGAS